MGKIWHAGCTLATPAPDQHNYVTLLEIDSKGFVVTGLFDYSDMTVLILMFLFSKHGSLCCLWTFLMINLIPTVLKLKILTLN